jgi:NAD-dependent protein deacetylase/lipoamidase
LTVYPVAYLPQIALAAGAHLVIVNEQPTPYDDAAHALFQSPIAEVLPALTSVV